MNLRKHFKRILGLSLVCCMVSGTGMALADTRLSINAEPVQGENYIHLNWNSLGPGYSYIIHSKGDGENIYQSIPSKKTVKTLNIYIDSGVSNTGLSQGQIDLDGRRVPDSGILKTWLLKENIDDVTIDCVSLSSFNANPSRYLTKTDGKWNYDSVFYGMWNFLPDVYYPNDNAVEYLRSFIKDGGGFMTSHHTIGYRGLDRGINKLWKEMGVEIFSTQPYTTSYIAGRDPRPYAGKDASGKLFDTVSFEGLSSLRPDLSPYWVSGKQVKIVKNGLLINYPFKVGNVGDIITIPDTHGLGLLGKGEVWMNVNNPGSFGGAPFQEITQSPRTGERGTNNFYVHTYNNTAIINSGHSFPQITKEETRIIANTLYYLSQITESTECDDHKAQDFAGPDKVNLTNVQNDGSRLSFSYSESRDNGTRYEYYITGKDREGNETVSDTTSAVNTSGLAGYSYIVDNSEDTIPDNIVETRELSAVQSLSNVDMTRPAYLHIVAVDNAGNISEVTHYKTGYPIIELTPSTTELTYEPVKITAKATSDSSRIAYVQTPAGDWIEGDTAEYTVTSNGTYTFAAIDDEARIVTQSITISNIGEGGIIFNAEPEEKTASIGETVNVDLTIDNITEISAEDVRLRYDTSKLELLGIEEVEGIKIAKTQTGDGTIRIICASKGIDNVVFSKKILAKMQFKAIGEGIAVVQVTKGRVADGISMERNVLDNQCGYGMITIE